MTSPSKGGMQSQQRLVGGPFSSVILTFKTIPNTLLHYTNKILYNPTHIGFLTPAFEE